MKNRAMWILTALMLVSTAIPSSAQARKRVVILPFDDRSAQYGAGGQVGSRISDELISKLSAMGTFEIIDQEHLNAVIQAQNQGYSDRFSATGAAKLGKLVNADVLIFGHVDSLSAESKMENKGNVLAQKQVQTGVVNINVTARVIAVETGTIITAPSASSEQSVVLSTHTSSSLPIVGVAATPSAPVYGNTWEAKQIEKAIDDVTTQISQKVSGTISSLQIAAAAPTLPKFVGMEDGLVVINKGQTAGIKVGQQFNVVRPTDSGLRDPDTNEPIIRKKKLCTMTITTVEEKISSGKCDGDAVPQKGDEITLPQ
jgi:hypothetical protein